MARTLPVRTSTSHDDASMASRSLRLTCLPRVDERLPDRYGLFFTHFGAVDEDEVQVGCTDLLQDVVDGREALGVAVHGAACELGRDPDVLPLDARRAQGLADLLVVAVRHRRVDEATAHSEVLLRRIDDGLAAGRFSTARAEAVRGHAQTASESYGVLVRMRDEQCGPADEPRERRASTCGHGHRRRAPAKGSTDREYRLQSQP
mmetsp:Transcript_10631/g.32958  ORF Transcript_10631/g.32958 Transcript_10631/m.32958 type:complete len:205 (+) Transcript_10631:521-1135(+)